MPKGTLVLVPFPFTDLSGQKVRPALVLYNQKGGEDCIVAFISSAGQKKVGKNDVVVAPSAHNGLKANSIIKISKLATLQKKIVLGELGTLEPEKLVEVDKKLKSLFQI